MTEAHGVAVIGDLAALDDVVAWYRSVSAGRATLSAVVLPAAEPAGGWSGYASRGGLGVAPLNSQGLAAAVLGATDRRAVADADGRAVIVTPPGAAFTPHVWRHLRGGMWLGGRTWARRYAVVPADAPVGTVAHELGHLLFNWPDHDRRSGIGADCLMGTGAAAAPPAPPSALERIGAGWTEAEQGRRDTVLGDLVPGRVVAVGPFLVERGPTGAVLVFAGGAVVARIDDDPDRPLLAVVRARGVSRGRRR